MESLNFPPVVAVSFIVMRAKEVAAKLGRRVAVGLAGGPGVGKSTIAAEVVKALNVEDKGSSALVPMDGFHMRHQKLIELGTVDYKGAPHTFEGAAFAAFLLRLKNAKTAVSGPGYSRQIEDVVDDAFTVAPEVRILIVEGNYLLLPDPPWDSVRRMLDLSIFLHVPRDKVGARLMKRHAEAGLFTEKRNRAHVARTDLPNYDLVAKSRDRADIAIDLETKA